MLIRITFNTKMVNFMEFLDNFTLKETKASKELYENPPENIINDAKV